MMHKYKFFFNAKQNPAEVEVIEIDSEIEFNLDRAFTKGYLHHEENGEHRFINMNRVTDILITREESK